MTSSESVVVGPLVIHVVPVSAGRASVDVEPVGTSSTAGEGACENSTTSAAVAIRRRDGALTVTTRGGVTTESARAGTTSRVVSGDSLVASGLPSHMRRPGQA